MSGTPRNLTVESFIVSRQEKEKLNGHGSFVVWLTGLSASGKSTIARILEERLHKSAIRTIVLDGDNTRLGINRDLDFSAAGREENIRRVVEMSSLMIEAGLVVIASFISPLAKDRQNARTIIGESSFIEVFVDAPLEVCIGRDPKGLYSKAIKGEISEFTGITGIYEAPQHPSVHIRSDDVSPAEAVDAIYSWLELNQFIFSQETIGSPSDATHSE